MKKNITINAIHDPEMTDEEILKEFEGFANKRKTAIHSMSDGEFTWIRADSYINAIKEAISLKGKQDWAEFERLKRKELKCEVCGEPQTCLHNDKCVFCLVEGAKKYTEDYVKAEKDAEFEKILNKSENLKDAKKRFKNL